MLRELPSSEIVWRLGFTLLHSAWQAAAASLLAAAAMRALRRKSPQVRYVVALGAMGLVLAAAVITFMLVTQPAHVRFDESEPLTMAGDPGPHEVSPALSPPAPHPRLAIGPPSAPAIAQSVRSGLSDLYSTAQPALPWMVLAWALGVSLLGLWNAGGWIAAQRLCVLDAVPVSQNVTDIVSHLARRLNLSWPTRVVQSVRVDTPLVIGWLRPMVLLPATVVSGLSPDQLQAILAHELAHVRRHDYLVNLLQVAAETLMFYHPAVWWISRRIRLEREQCCDDIAVAVCGDPRRYVESLAALEEVRISSPLAMAARGSNDGQLLTRVRRLLTPTEEGGRRHARATFTWLLLIVAVTTAFACMHQRARPNAAAANVISPRELGHHIAASERPIRNLMVGEFDLTMDSLPEGSTTWQKTPYHVTGTAWYGDPAGGKARLDITQETLAYEPAPPASVETGAYSVGFDGRSGRVVYELRDFRNPGQGGTAQTWPGTQPSMLKNEFYQYATGISFLPNYTAKREGRVAVQIPSALKREIMLDTSADQLDGRPVIKRELRVNHNHYYDVSWFDPKRGYVLVGYDRVVAGKWRESMRVSDWIEAAPGIWYPTRAYHEGPAIGPNPNVKRRYNYSAKKVVANNPTFDDSIFIVPIPPRFVVTEMREPVPPKVEDLSPPPAPATAEGAVERQNRIKSGNNLRQIGQALVLYANEHNGAYPPDLATLVSTEDLPAKSLKSPIGDEKNGTDYIYLCAKGVARPIPDNRAIAYDAPDAARSGGASVLFGDGHVKWLDAAALGAVLDAAKAADAGAHEAVRKPKVLLVTEGDYYLQKALAALETFEVDVIPLAKYDTRGGAGYAITIFDTCQPAVAPRGPAIYFNVTPPGATLTVEKDAKGDPLRVKDLGITNWVRDHPALVGINFEKLYAGDAMKLRVPADWETIASSGQNPVIAAHRGPRTREIVVAFNPKDSNWPLRSSFPLFLHQSISRLIAEEAPPKAATKESPSSRQARQEPALDGVSESAAAELNILRLDATDIRVRGAEVQAKVKRAEFKRIAKLHDQLQSSDEEFEKAQAEAELADLNILQEKQDLAVKLAKLRIREALLHRSKRSADRSAATKPATAPDAVPTDTIPTDK